MKNIKIIAGTLLPVLWFTVNPVCSQSLNHRARENASYNDSTVTSRIFQFSLLPYISINQVPANSVVDVSLNLIAGYVREVRAIEIGGVLNIDREDAGKCQLAGVGNTVGGSFHGFQAAGVYNTTQTMKGFQAGGVINMVKADAGNCQLAGVGNMVGGNFIGFQAAGVYNMAQSIKGTQACGVINMIKADAGKCQLAGVGNIVGGSSSGLQMAGVFNCATSQSGFQASGVANVIKKNAGKCQLAGVGNIVGDSFEGFQGAGVINTANSANGIQVAGVLNTAREDAKSCQLAGVGNLVGESFHGFQAAGVFNSAKSVRGLQIAGVLNNSQEVNGTQISGLINKASFFKGLQLSVFNFADSCEGIPIGVISFVRKNGYHKIELSTDEIFYTNLAFRTGVPHFYTTIMAGIRPDNFAKPLWAYGFGIGTKFGKQSNFSYDLELSSQHVSKENFSDYVSDLHKLYFGIDRKLTHSASIAIGITYNFFITDTDAPHYNEKLSTIAPYKLTNDTYNKNGINIKTWIGGKIAIRFL